jgi:DNA polymerase elongation subunit (family B)
MDELSELGNKTNGNIIYYNGEEDIYKLIRRNDLYKYDKITSVINNYIDKKQTILFMPNDINEDNHNKYILKIFGILMNGAKVEVNIIDIDVFFDVAIPTGISPNIIHNELNIMLGDMGISYDIKDIYAYPLHGYNKEKQLFKRIFTNNTFDRLKLLKIVKDQMNLETYSNDTNNYYRKASRENKLYLSDWVSLSNYECIQGPTNHSPSCVYIFNVTKENYIHVTDINIRNLPKVIKDRTLVMAWDIETYSNRKTGEVPSPEYDSDIVFMICLSVHWLHESNSLYKICIVDKESDTDSRWDTIICDTEVNILKAMAICWNHFSPDIFIGYNDSCYDWPFVIEKSVKYNILPWMWKKMSAYQCNQTMENIIKRFYNDRRKKDIKINAEKVFSGYCLNIPGTISIDCLPCFMKLYPRLETNKYGTLKFYLQDNNLPAKVDLPIPLLWKYYENGTNIRDIAYYCIVDTISVQRLFVKRNIITDYREVSTLAYVSLSDSHYYAGGIKVCNLLGAYAWPDILVNMKPKYHSKSDKYPGAYVFVPDKGMTPNIERLNKLKNSINKEEAINNFKKDRPVSCLDFASLYPSLIITYNLSPEKIIINKEDYIKLNTQHNLHDINFDVGSRKIQAWSIMHDNDTTNMGLFPKILCNLFDKRKEMKKILKQYIDKKELYERILNKNNKDYKYVIEDIINKFNEEIIELNTDINYIPPGSTIEDEKNTRIKRIDNIKYMISILNTFNYETIEQDYNDICFMKNCIDKKQNALKIYMNTFYGETGNHLSPFFLLELAGGVTSAGQTNIKLVASYAENKGFNIKYGDSVMPYTPITYKINDMIFIESIDSFDNVEGWINYPEFKIDKSFRSDKKQLIIDNDILIWTKNKWSKIIKIIKHKTIKKIYRIITTSSLIDVTEDHSLLTYEGDIIKPSDCKIGTKLFHNRLSNYNSNYTNTNIIFNTQVETQRSYISLQLKGYNVLVNYNKQADKYILSYDNIYNPNYNEIKEIYILYEDYFGYVYDIETEDGTFHAGIGNLIVKNTDSLYLTCPNNYFRECDEKYINGEYTKLDFFTAMVKITLRIISKFEQEINQFLAIQNNTPYLKMENEGCNYPCLFLGKKKYFGIQHINDVNFNPKKLYIKGIEVIKQGKSGIEKEIGNTIMRTAVSIDNELDIIDIVKNILYDSINSNKWKFEDFIQTSTWKPTKDNKSVQSFVKRMNARHLIELRENELLIQKGLKPNPILYSPLEPGERFSYVIIKNDILYNIQGKKINIKAGDIMEYAHIAKDNNMTIDVVYYLIHYVIGICARFISSNDQFMPPKEKLELMDDKKLDEYTVKQAKKMLEDYVKSLSGISKKDIIEKGKECKLLFKNAVQICTSNFSNNIIKDSLIKMTFADESDDYIDILFKHANKHAIIIYKKYFTAFCNDLCIYYNIDPDIGSNIDNSNQSNNLYKQLQIEKNKKYLLIGKLEYNLRKKIKDISLNDICISFKTDIMHIIDNMKKNNEIITISDHYDLSEFVSIWNEILGLELYKLQHTSFIEYLDNLKFKRTKNIKTPSHDIKTIVESLITAS